MIKLNCIVTDDERTAREGLMHYVNQIPYLSLIAKCKSAIELDAVLLQEKVDLVLLDINMPGISGLEWLKHTQKPPFVIFTTAHREYALDGFELNVVDYLLKPISFARFSQAVHKAYKLFQSTVPTEKKSKEEDRYIFIKEDSQAVKIFLKDILYFEAAVDYIYIHTTQKRYMTLFSMKQVEQEVAEEHFLRIHRSFIVNTRLVKMIEGKMLLIGNTRLPISRNLYQDVYDTLVSKNLWKE